MEPSLAKKIAYQALMDQKDFFFKEWEAHKKIPPDDPYKDQIGYNTHTLFNHILHTICFPMEEDKIKRLAYKVAIERAKANIEKETDLDDCTYNIALIRETILTMCYQVQLPRNYLLPIIIKVNRCIDLFLSELVSQYTMFKSMDFENLDDHLAAITKERTSLAEQVASIIVQNVVFPLEKMKQRVEELNQACRDDPNIIEILKDIQLIQPYLMNYRILSSHPPKENVPAQYISLASVIEDVLSFFEPRFQKEQITLHFQPTVEGFIFGQEAEIKQAIFCIIENALDALQLKGDPPRNVEIEMKDDRVFVELDIRNNGPYIPTRHQAALFDPFFTTKPESAGVGLYLSKKVIDQYNGSITIYSGQEWTTFTIKFPSCTAFQVVK